MAKGRWEGLVVGVGFAMGGPVSSRYHIEDLVSQDESGAVFRAVDMETGDQVAIRRFFPTGGAGGGFFKEEVDGYLQTVEALRQVVHDALLPIVDGGVDEVDGVPFLVMGWAEGQSLAEKLEEGPLDAEEAVAMVARGLEGLRVLEQMFGAEARWLEMETKAVVVTAGEVDFRFWICPFQWLGVADRDGGVRGLGYLAEHVMGWDGQEVPAAAAAGLSGWIAQAKQGGWPLDEAYAALVQVRSFWTGEETAPVIKEVPPEAVTAMPPPAVTGGGLGTGVVPPTAGLATRSSSGGAMRLFIGGIAAACLVLAGLVWALVAQPWAADDPVVLEGGLRVFTWEDGEALRKWVGTTIILEGTLLRVRDSRSGKTRYLEFQEDTSPNAVCGWFKKANPHGRNLDALRALEGEKIRCKGKVAIEPGTGRVVVDMKAPPVSVALD